MKTAVILFAVVAIVAVNSAPLNDSNNVAKCLADNAKDYTKSLSDFNKNAVEALKAETNPTAKAQLIKQQNERRIQIAKDHFSQNPCTAEANKLKAADVPADNKSKTKLFDSKKATQIAKCRTDAAKVFMDESITLNKANAKQLSEEKDPKQRAEIIKQQFERRNLRTQQRLAEVKADLCGKAANAAEGL